ncbi:zinc finger E-box-binding homeobox 1-like [Artemia franciscana]|uniref:C2H2-type domain-containing protein n=1 Tax=Artemia franciscana TaxID=6661 RepID=A0AA88LFQ3_ARTSF|nr:hypothetical protein QYM36_005402 [Artemia franciscana]
MTTLDFELDWFFPISPDDGYGSRTQSVGSQDGDILNDQFINLFPSVADDIKKNESLVSLSDLDLYCKTEIAGKNISVSQIRNEIGNKKEEWISKYLSKPKLAEIQDGYKNDQILKNSAVNIKHVKVKSGEKSGYNIKSTSCNSANEIENVKDGLRIQKTGTEPCQTSFCVTQQHIARLLAEDTSKDFQTEQLVSDISSNPRKPSSEIVEISSIYQPDNIKIKNDSKTEFPFLRRLLTKDRKLQNSSRKPGGKVIIERREEPLFVSVPSKTSAPDKKDQADITRKIRDSGRKRAKKTKMSRNKNNISELQETCTTLAMLPHPTLEIHQNNCESTTILSTAEMGVQRSEINVLNPPQDNNLDLLFDIPTLVGLRTVASETDSTYTNLLPVSEAVNTDFPYSVAMSEPSLEQFLTDLLEETDATKPHQVGGEINDLQPDSLSDLLFLDTVFQSNSSVVSANSDTTVPSDSYMDSPNIYSDVSSDSVNNSYDSNNNSAYPTQNQSTNSKNALDAVEIRSKSNHTCRICGKVFKDKYSVTVHVRVHSGEKPFPCSLCSKPFRQKAHLAKHFLTHTNPNGRKRKRELKLLEEDKTLKKKKKIS